MGLGADMQEWVEESGYEGDDPFGAWNADLQYRAFGGCCLEEIEAHEARGLTWNQEKQRWLPAEQNQDRAEEVPKKQKARAVVHTSTNATCSACKQKKAKADFSKRQWNTKGAQARCMSCVNNRGRPLSTIFHSRSILSGEVSDSAAPLWSHP
ncbi:Stc1 domain-containing protein [Pseudoscourfieldia marina]